MITNWKNYYYKMIFIPSKYYIQYLQTPIKVLIFRYKRVELRYEFPTSRSPQGSLSISTWNICSFLLSHGLCRITNWLPWCSTSSTSASWGLGWSSGWGLYTARWWSLGDSVTHFLVWLGPKLLESGRVSAKFCQTLLKSAGVELDSLQQTPVKSGNSSKPHTLNS